jgi:hypothetical protein
VTTPPLSQPADHGQAPAIGLRRRLTVGALMALGIVGGLALVARQGGSPFFDGVAYYVVDLSHLYEYARVSLLAYGAYRYSPILAQLIDPFGALPLVVFIAGWTMLLFAALAYTGGRRWWVLLGIPFVILELYAGNVHLLIALAVVVGFRFPGAWAFIALTKITPFLGVTWFAFRREWRSLAIAIGTTALIVAVGVALAPGLWREWFDSLTFSAGQPSLGIGGPLLLRGPIALILIAWAAPRDKRWLLPVAVVLLLPNIWLHSLSILAASVALWPGFRLPFRAQAAPTTT